LELRKSEGDGTEAYYVLKSMANQQLVYKWL